MASINEYELGAHTAICVWFTNFHGPQLDINASDNRRPPAPPRLRPHCMYRSPLGSMADAGHILESPPRGWVCGCPAGEHEMGANCVDSQAKCAIARRYGRTGLPSYSYQKRKHLQEVEA